jgi:Mg/Co/Ni transporter MgtE
LIEVALIVNLLVADQIGSATPPVVDRLKVDPPPGG